jgi:hypothetical protein
MKKTRFKPKNPEVCIGETRKLQQSATAATQTKFYFNRYTQVIPTQTTVADVAAHVADVGKVLPRHSAIKSLSYRAVADIADIYIVRVNNRYIPLYSISPNQTRFQLQCCHSDLATAYNRFERGRA